MGSNGGGDLATIVKRAEPEKIAMELDAYLANNRQLEKYISTKAMEYHWTGDVSQMLGIREGEHLSATEFLRLKYYAMLVLKERMGER